MGGGLGAVNATGDGVGTSGRSRGGWVEPGVGPSPTDEGRSDLARQNRIRDADRTLPTGSGDTRDGAATQLGSPCPPRDAAQPSRRRPPLRAHTPLRHDNARTLEACGRLHRQPHPSARASLCDYAVTITLPNFGHPPPTSDHRPFSSA